MLSFLLFFQRKAVVAKFFSKNLWKFFSRFLKQIFEGFFGQVFAGPTITKYFNAPSEKNELLFNFRCQESGQRKSEGQIITAS